MPAHKNDKNFRGARITFPRDTVASNLLIVCSIVRQIDYVKVMLHLFRWISGWIPALGVEKANKLRARESSLQTKEKGKLSRIKMAHEWKKEKISQPSLCFSCHKPIWAPFSSAVRCTTCSLLGHKACAKKTSVRCTKMAPQSFMPVGVVRVRVISGVNMDMKTDCFCTLQLDQQTATTRIAFGQSFWNQTFTFIVTSSSKHKLVIECYEQEYLENVFLGSCAIPNLHEYTQQEELFVDLQRGGVRTKKTLQLAIEYHRLYAHDVEWDFDTTVSSPPPAKGGFATPLNRRLKRRHSAGQSNAKSATEFSITYHPQGANPKDIPASTSSHTAPVSEEFGSPSAKSASVQFPRGMSTSLSSVHVYPASSSPEQYVSSPSDAKISLSASNHNLLLPPMSTTPPSLSNSSISTTALTSSYHSDDRQHDSDEDSSDDEDDEFIMLRDHFGFKIETAHMDAYLATFEFQFTTRMREQAEYLAKNLNKILSCSVSRPMVTREFVGFARSGFPLSHRGDLWQALSGSRDAMRRHPGLYRRLLEEHEGEESLATQQIEKDLRRTFISNPFLKTRRDRERLQRVLNAFSFYDPQTGYCQSLNFIAALFLLLMGEEEAFWLLIVTTRKYLPEYYTPDMVGSKTDAHIFEAMLYTYFPIIAHQLFDLGLPVVLRTASWFLCMFVTILPIETTMRVFDWMFVEGSQILFSIGLALFDLSSISLSQADSFDSAYFTFTTMTSSCFNADHLIDLAATKYQVVRKEIAALRTKLRLEYSRRDEQELLSSLNLSPDDFYALVSQIESVSKSELERSRGGNLATPSRKKAPVPTSAKKSATTSSDQLKPLGSSSKLASSGVLPPAEKVENAEVEASVLDKIKFVSVFVKLFPSIETAVAESMFDMLDSDDDKVLTIKECLLGISAFVVGEADKKALMWFRVFDKNNDGILDTTEIKALLSLVWKLIDKQLDHSWIDEFLEVVEKTHAGRITRQEFVTACLDMPVLSDWLKFGFTLGDRVKVLAAKAETAQTVAELPELPLPSFRPSDSASELPALSTTPPASWIDEDGRVNPLLVAGTVSPPRQRSGTASPTERFQTSTDEDQEGFIFV